MKNSIILGSMFIGVSILFSSILISFILVNSSSNFIIFVLLILGGLLLFLFAIMVTLLMPISPNSHKNIFLENAIETTKNKFKD